MGTRLVVHAVVIAALAACGNGTPAKGPTPESGATVERSGSGSSSASGSAAAVSREDCREILEKSDRLMGHDSTSHPRSPEKTEREIDECVREATPAALACAERATTMDELEACER